MAEILVVDDDPHLREVVCYALGRAGYAVREAADGRAALEAVAAREPDLVVLDVLMPEMDGLAVLRELRRTSRVPVVILSSRGEEVDRVVGLELGADDYVPKPFSPRELVSRVRAVLRRSLPAPAGPLEAGPIRLDRAAFRCTVAGAELHLTPTEFRLLAALVEARGRALDRRRLALAAYEGRHFVSDRTIDSHIRNLREKLRAAAPAFDPITTVHGVGYRLDA